MSLEDERETSPPQIIKEAIGHPDTGYFVKTPRKADRVWPVWSLRPHLTEYPTLQQRWDEGGPVTLSVVEELWQFVRATHQMVGNGVWVFTVAAEDMNFYPSVFSSVPGRGHFAAWLDSLDRSEYHAFPEVVDLKLAEMLHRRGYEMMSIAADTASDDDWLPVHLQEPKP